LQTSVCMFFGASCNVIAGTLAVIAAFLLPGEPKAI